MTEFRIRLPRDCYFKDPVFYTEEIWHPARRERKERKISQRGWEDTFYLICDYEDQIIDANGAPYTVPNISQICEPRETRARKVPIEMRDNDLKWMAYFLKAAPCGTRPLQMTQRLDRLELIYLYCQIRRYEAYLRKPRFL